jgi:hypothetical protein
MSLLSAPLERRVVPIFSSYYCTRKPDYYRLNSRWSQRENFDVTKERKPRSCSTGISPCGTSAVKKRIYALLI